MADLDDLQLNYNSGPSMPEPNRQRLKVVVIGVLVLVFAISGYLAWRARVQPAPVAAVQQQPPPRAAASPTGIQREPGDNIPLPPIDETDPLVRELVAKLSSHPKIAAWLTTDKLIRNFAVVVVNIGDGHTPTTHLRAIPLSAPFAASADSGSGSDHVGQLPTVRRVCRRDCRARRARIGAPLRHAQTADSGCVSRSRVSTG